MLWQEIDRWKPVDRFAAYQKIIGEQPLSKRETAERAALAVSAVVLIPDLSPLPDFPRAIKTRENNFISSAYSQLQILQRRGRPYLDSFVTNYGKVILEVANTFRTLGDLIFFDSLARRTRELVTTNDFEHRNIFNAPLNALIICIERRARTVFI